VDSFDVVTLGAPGAGTTSFLAAMFGQLKAGPPGNGPFLDISLAQARMLHSMVADPVAGWPQAAPPDPVPAWEFTCCIRAAGRVFEIFRINYLDFAGVRLRQALFGNTAVGHRFQQKIVSAHALLGVLDGLALRYLLDDDPRGERLDGPGMKTIFQIMRTHAGRRPVHLVVSKWDLLADAYELGDVRAKLMEFGDFAALARSGAPGRPAPLVRLIPVGALGSGFARLDAAGIVRKRAGVSSPVNAEIPLVALPIDFYHAAASLESGVEPMVTTPGRGRPAQRLRERTRLLAGGLPADARTSGPARDGGPLSGGPVGSGPVTNWPRISEDLLGGLADVLTQAPWDGAADVVDQRSAVRETVLNFRRQLERFEERYPASLPKSQPAEDG
jgi:hypothetical protein